MLVAVYLVLLGVVAVLLRRRLSLLSALPGFPGYLAALGVTLFLADWINFLAHALAGWSWLYWIIAWAAPAVALVFFTRDTAPTRFNLPDLLRPLAAPRTWNGCFLFFLGFVLLRFYTGIVIDADDRVWVNYNFVDTAFHLSVVNAFLEADSFPPMDLDMAGYPLKYHFLADFFVAHLAQMGAPRIGAMWLMNLIGASVLVGTIWSVFTHWLRLPPRWVLLAGLLFLFLNTSLVNLLHFLWLRPPFFNVSDFYYGLFWFPYFNFEAMLTNLFEPQRALLFTLPIALLVLHAIFHLHETSPAPTHLLHAFIVICLLPLAHIVAFAVLAACMLPALWRHRSWFFSQWRAWLPFFALGLLQLIYLQAYGPPTHPAYSSWDATASLPLNEYSIFPRYLRRLVFWFFVNGDFLGWGAFFVGLAFLLRLRQRDPGPGAPLLGFLHHWRWYFAVCLTIFVVINFYRYSFSWGDSNKFVLFLNLGLALVITLGAARWITTRLAPLSLVFWWFFAVLCVAPHAYGFYRNVLAAPHGKILLFEPNGRAAARWLQTVHQTDELVVTAPYNLIHFVTPLAGFPTLAGIYADSNPYRQDEREAQIRRIYEQADLRLLRELGATYVCISRNERRKVTLHPRWIQFMKDRTAVAFHAGGGPDDFHSVYIFDARLLPPE
jgi:hypothetical protein